MTQLEKNKIYASERSRQATATSFFLFIGFLGQVAITLPIKNISMYFHLGNANDNVVKHDPNDLVELTAGEIDLLQKNGNPKIQRILKESLLL